MSHRSLFLLICDLIALALAYGFGFYVRTGFALDFAISKLYSLYASFLIFPAFFYIFDLYYPFKRFRNMQTFVEILMSVSAGILFSAAAAYADKSLVLPRMIFLYTMLSLIPLILFIRIFYDYVIGSRYLDKRALILGTGPLALEITRVIREIPHSGIEVVGLIWESKKPAEKSKNGVPIVGGVKDLISLIDWYKVDLAVLSLDPREEVSEAQVTAELLRKRINVTSSIHLFEKLSQDIPYKLLGSHYLLGLASQVRTRPFLKIKRIMDISCGLILFAAFFPFFLPAFLLLALEDPKRIFFTQDRIGKDSVLFKLIKLRTMTAAKKGKPKVTFLGKWIRRFRIDEIPQMINVLRGDMSLVGPRPEIPYFVTRCRKRIPFYDTVFAVKPGLTGWAQVKFRHATTAKEYDQKFRYNLYYLKNISLGLDLLIALKTIRVVLLGKGK